MPSGVISVKATWTTNSGSTHVARLFIPENGGGPGVRMARRKAKGRR